MQRPLSMSARIVAVLHRRRIAFEAAVSLPRHHCSSETAIRREPLCLASPIGHSVVRLIEVESVVRLIALATAHLPICLVVLRPVPQVGISSRLESHSRLRSNLRQTAPARPAHLSPASEKTLPVARLETSPLAEAADSLLPEEVEPNLAPASSASLRSQVQRPSHHRMPVGAALSRQRVSQEPRSKAKRPRRNWIPRPPSPAA